MPVELYEGATEPVYFGDRKVWSVTGFLSGVRRRVVEVPSMWVQGEISDFKHQRHLSMVYFTLKDPENGFRLSCTMGRTRFEQLGITVSDGDRVQIYGRADIYEPHGVFQLRAQSIEHMGRGMLMQRLEALKSKLEREGLFDESRKRPIPAMPRRVGVITGADAAAQGDFLRNVFERFPPTKLVMIETLVQGERAAPLLLAALRKLEQVDDVDVIVITRGGGAFEHFLPFSDERLCRAIAACPKPVVSAIGHEKDSPISDLVADLRVSTPTAAARTVVPDFAEISGRLQRHHHAIQGRMRDRIRFHRNGVTALRTRLSNHSPARVVEERQRLVAQLRHRSRRRVGALVDLGGSRAVSLRRALASAGGVHQSQAIARHQRAYAALRALSPAATLERGYSIVRRYSDGSIVRDSAQVDEREDVTITVARGALRATVRSVEEGEAR